MKVRTTMAMAGHTFSFRHGEEVDEEYFASTIGNGWRNLCESIETPEVDDSDTELAVDSQPAEAAVRRPRVERRKGKR